MNKNVIKTVRITQIDPKWVTVQVASDWLGVSVRTTRRYIAQGLIEAKRFGPRTMRIDLASLKGFGDVVETGELH